MKNIIIVGLKHCGKSNVGRLLAKTLQRPYYDADHLLEVRYFAQYQKQLGVREIYSRLGKPAFDRLQVSVLEELFERCNDMPFLLALGGGAGDLAEIGQLLDENDSIIILLEQELPVLFERISRGGLPPFLQSAWNAGGPEAAFAEFCKLSEPRLRRYRAWADIIVPCTQRSPQNIATELASIDSNGIPKTIG